MPPGAWDTPTVRLVYAASRARAASASARSPAARRIDAGLPAAIQIGGWGRWVGGGSTTMSSKAPEAAVVREAGALVK